MRPVGRSAFRPGLVGLSVGVLAATLVVGGAAASPALADETEVAATEGGAIVGPDAPAQTVETVVITQEFAALPERAGDVRVTRRFDVPDTVESLRTTLPDAATVTGTSGGFTRIEPRRYEWTGGSKQPAIHYTLSVNQTGEVRGPEGADGRYLFADVGAWGLFRRPQAPTDVTYRGSAIRFEQRTTTRGPGAAGDWLVYVGEHEETRRTAHGQTFRFVEPATADLAESREAILESVTAASEALRVGQRDGEVLVVAAPTTVDWAVEGLQTGESDFYVTADERLDDANNVWLHEYVHTRQDFETARDARWVTEATATYYAALLTLEQERIDGAAFARVVGVGADSRYSSVVLSAPSTWTQGANYRKGGLVAGDIDRRLRVATDNTSDFQAVFRRLNEKREAVTAADFVSAVRAAGTDDVAATADRYTTTAERVRMWSRADHQAAFGTLPPRIRLSLPDADGNDGSYRVDGPFRSRALDEPPFVLVPGETLSIDVAIANSGGVAGTYNVSYGLDGGTIEYRTGSVGVDETVTETVAVSVEAVGERTVRVGEYAIPVTVAEVADLDVTGVRAERTTVAPGETVAIEVDVENPTDRPGLRDLAVRRDGATLDTETVRLDAGESRTVGFSVELDEPGDHRLAVDGHAVTVRVGSPDGVGAVGPGPGPVGATLAVLLGIALALARRT